MESWKSRGSPRRSLPGNNRDSSSRCCTKWSNMGQGAPEGDTFSRRSLEARILTDFAQSDPFLAGLNVLLRSISMRWMIWSMRLLFPYCSRAKHVLTTGLKYAPTTGVPELRQKVADYYNDTFRQGKERSALRVPLDTSFLDAATRKQQIRSGQRLHCARWESWLDTG
jgi:hypothetical protein